MEMGSVFEDLRVACEVFAEDVEFEVYACADFDVVEVGCLVGIWNDVYLKRGVGWVANCEAYPIYGD